MNGATSHPSSFALLVIVFIAIAGLILLVGKFKLNAFVALILASLFVGLCAGMKLADIPKTFQGGRGAVLASVAVVVGLGTMLGKMLAESGGAEVIARSVIAVFGQKRIDWAMVFIALIVGIPVWFSVGLVLLLPIVLTLARETKTPLLFLGVPLLAGLSIAHGLIPPHPGPMAAIELLRADLGKTILYSFMIGVPTAILVGPILGRFLAPRITVEPGAMAEQLTRKSERTNLPGFALTLFTILLPIILMLAASGADVFLEKTGRYGQLREWLDFLGSPIVALLAGVLFSFYSFGFARGFVRKQVSKFVEDCLAPVATVLLVVGAGGGFSRVLLASGVGDSMAGLANKLNVSPLIFGWLVAALIRVAAGSATGAIPTAAGIMAPILVAFPGTKLELLVIAMGAGSSVLSHLRSEE